MLAIGTLGAVVALTLGAAFVVTERTSSAGNDTLIAAGDIGVCGDPADEATAAIVEGIPGTVAALGDNAYPNGSSDDFRNCYDPSWGQFKNRTRPVPGNHEYVTPAAAGYFAYFGLSVGTPGHSWYAYDLNGWRLYALDANCGNIGGCGAGSAELTWLAADLAANPRPCVLAYWHEPRWSSGLHGNDQDLDAIWRALSAAGTDIVLNGHDHDYERFVPMTADGSAATAGGIREFVVGTGGVGLRDFATIDATSTVRNSVTHGVLKLTLDATGYAWQFLPVAPGTFTDSGTGTCG